MLRLHNALQNYQAQMLLQVHDELLLELPEDEVETINPMVEEIMSGAFQLDVPLKVETSTGANWLELKD
jgi:DNA polymerase-1